MRTWGLGWGLVAVVAALGTMAVGQPTCDDNSLYVPTATGSGDPCAGRSYVAPPDQEHDYYRWVTEADGGGQLPVESAGWQSLIYPYAGAGAIGQVALPWNYPDDGLNDSPHVPVGFRSNRNPLMGPSPGDFLPVGKNLAEHSTCLLPPDGAAIFTDWQGTYRPTLDGKVDLVTGLPLVQVTDLELPLGGATFRLTRTRSERRYDNQARLNGEANQIISSPDQWWDWAGMGWMISENPLLVIESALPDVTGDQPYTSYFIVDAHHSIPFQLIEGTGVFEAPPRFRARMTYKGGLWDEVNGKYQWVDRPEQFDVYLYDGALHYTFVAIWEDVPPRKWNATPYGGGASEDSSYHDKPIVPSDNSYATPYDYDGSPGWGLPYYGLCTKVEDKYGHSVEIEYCDVRSSEMDDPGTEDCTECQQRAIQKGQIRSIKLKDHGVVRWTLVYAHRVFAGLRSEEWYNLAPPRYSNSGDPADDTAGYEWVADEYKDEEDDPNDQRAYRPEFYEIHGHVAVDRIYAFNVDIPDALLGAMEPYLSISHTDTGSLGDSGYEPLAEYNAAHPEDQITGWAYKVRYYYDANPSTGRPLSPPLLIRTDTMTAPAGGGEPTVRHRAFQYDLEVWTSFGDYAYKWSEYYTDPDRWGENEMGHVPWLRYIFENEGLAQLQQDWNDPAKWDTETLLGDFDLNALGRNRPGGGGVPYYHDADSNTEPAPDILSRYASVEYTPRTDPIWGDGSTNGPHSPNIDSLRNAPGQQLFVSSGDGQLKNDTAFPIVHDVSFTDGEGVRRHYRINRLAYIKAGSDFAPQFTPSAGFIPTRSLFAHPYYWAAYNFNGLVPESLWRERQLDQTRWIAILDEYDSRKALKDRLADYDGGDYSIRTGQFNRRVVEMNPTGYILRDLRWDFKDGQALVSGGGLGEQFIYKTAAQYFEDAGNPMPPVDDYPPGEDPWALVRNEPYLVEHRSVGWSAGWLGNDPPTDPNDPNDFGQVDERAEGLVRFFEYEFNDVQTAELDFESWPASSRVYLVAEGVQAGAGDPNGYQPPRYYTRQIVHDPDRPMDVKAEVEFTSGQASSALLDPSDPSIFPDDPSGPPVEGATIRQYRTVWRAPADGETPETERAADARLVIGPPRQQHAGPDWYYPVEAEFYDDDGNSTWSASGLVRHPTAPNSDPPDDYESLIFTYYERDPEIGASKFTVVDAVARAEDVRSTSNSVVTSLAIADWPDLNGSPWRRISQLDPANSVTEFDYDERLGLVDIYMPNYRRWSKRICVIDPQIDHGPGIDEDAQRVPVKFAREYIFNDLHRNGVYVNGNDAFFIGSPAEVNDYATEEPEGSPRIRRKTMLDDAEGGGLSVPVPLWTYGLGPAYTEFWRVKMALDANGRPQEAQLIEPDVNGAMIALGTKMFNDLGEVTREQEIDGSITRVTKNQLGFPLRTYVGTRDTAWVEAEQDLWGGDPEAYNMLLTSRTEYGLGVNDAWQPTVVREYRSVPGGDLGGSADWTVYHHGAPPAVDPDGYATVTSYDWRMRPVRTDSFGKGDLTTAPRLSTTLTFLDHADRPRLIVTFGEGSLTLPDALDPTKLGDQPNPAESIPDAEAFYALSLRPISITGMDYGSDGTMTVRRTYDMAWDNTGGSAPFLAEHQYAGQGGQVVYSQQPGQPITRNVLDSFGRVSQTLSLLPDANGAGQEDQLARTEYRYDLDGNVAQTLQWTRVLASTDPLASGDNAVRTRSVSWYDKQKRLIATADLGTEDPDDEWVFSPETYTHDPNDPPTWSAATGVVLPPDFPATAQVWVYVYDIYGNQTHVVDPKGLVTAYEYTPTGRVKKKTENAGGAPADQRVTEYQHQWGRVTSMAMGRLVNDGPNLGETQTSRVVYVDEDTDGDCQNGQGCDDSRQGAEVVDESFTVVSRNNAAVKWLELLGADTPSGDPQNPDLTFRYTFSGQVAERTDARGVTFRYSYDALGRVASIEVGHYAGTWQSGYPGSMDGPNNEAPADRVGYLAYEYDAAGRLSDVRTYDVLGGVLITHNRYEYDDAGGQVGGGRGDLVADVQSQGAEVSASSPRTTYAWEYLPTDLASGQPGQHRLTTLVYPTHDGSTPRAITLVYSDPIDQDGRLARIGSITSNFGSVPFLAAFEYVGVGRRSKTELAGGEIAQSFRTSGAVGLAGLDAFGRVKDLHFTNTLADTLLRAEYSYDLSGNRVTSRLTQAPDGSGTPQANIRSQFNSYDGLNRLASTEVGTIIQNGNLFAIDPSSLVRTDEWNLDLLGNWTGGGLAGAQTTGRESWGNLDGYGTDYLLPGADSAADHWSLTHQVDDLNELTEIENLDNDSTMEISRHDPVYDEAGNLVFDGNYYFQYDAWNRLLQVNEASLDAQGQVVMGDLLKHFMFDGLGRLVRTQTPTVPGGSSLRTERFYYDGLRRIQELVTLPVTTLGGAQGNSQLEALASQTVTPGSNPDQQTAPAGYEEGQLALGGGGGGSSSGTVSREYVWGPGDNGFDELLVQYDQFGNEAWAIQDAGGDLVAMCDLNGEDGLGNPGFARVVGQWTFDAYGEVLTAEYLQSFASPHLGHKGLFLDRLDGTVNSPRLVPFGHSLYHMRNRTYAPGLGRFLQRDPNQTAMALVEATAMHGRSLGALTLAFELEGLYGDGGNLYEYGGSNPWSRSDPLGLSWDPFSMVDDYLAESSGERAAFMERIISAAQTAAYIGAVIASTLPLPLPVGILADVGADALEGQVSPELVKMRKLLGVASLTVLTATVAKLGFSAIKTSVQYVMQHGMRGTVKNLWNSTIGLARRGSDWLEHKWRKLVKASCGCFVGATAVLTPTGHAQISDLREGDAVFAAREHSDGLSPDVALVEEQVVIPEASTLRLTLRHADGSIESIHTTDEHPFHLAVEQEWARADELWCGSQLSALTGPATVLALSFDLERVPVYNLSIPDVPTYYVGEHGVWTHNCPFDRVRDYWQPVYGWKGPPRAEVRLLNLNTGEKVVKVVSKDVHHRQGRFWGGSDDLDNLEELWPWEHARIDPDRNRSFPYELLEVIQFIPPKR